MIQGTARQEGEYLDYVVRGYEEDMPRKIRADPTDRNTQPLNLEDPDLEFIALNPGLIHTKTRPIGKEVNEAYTFQEIYDAVVQRCHNEHSVEITDVLKEDDKIGGCSYTFHGISNHNIGAEKALVNALYHIDPTLKGEEALDSMKVKLSEVQIDGKATGRYVIEDVSVKSEYLPSDYFDENATIPEHWSIFGNDIGLPLGVVYDTEQEPLNVSARLFDALEKLNVNGHAHLNPNETEEVFVKAIIKLDKDMPFEELRTHLNLDGSEYVPRMVVIDNVKLKNRDNADVDPEQRDYDLPILITEFVKGKTLETYLEENKHSERDTLALYAKVARAVDDIHSRGIVHRDLKPKNIMVTEDGNIKITDFGTAYQPTTTPPDSGRINATLYYISPEHLECVVDSRMDVYSLGASFAELTLGATPFHDFAEITHNWLTTGEKDKESILEKLKKTPREVATELVGTLYTTVKNETFLKQNKKGRFVFDPTFRDPNKRAEVEKNLKETSERACDIMIKCVRGDMSERYQSARELAEALEGAVESMDLYTLVNTNLAKAEEGDPIFSRKPPENELIPAISQEDLEPLSAQFLKGEDPAPGKGIGIPLFGDDYAAVESAKKASRDNGNNGRVSKLFGIISTHTKK